jgi:hypothetical protein
MLVGFNVALECAVCQSVYDERCMDPFVMYPEAKFDCSSLEKVNATVCRKIKQKGEMF